MTAPSAELRVAGFWARAAAWSLDAAVLLPLALLLGGPLLAPAWQAAQAAWAALPATLGQRLAAGVDAGVADPLALAIQLARDPALAAQIGALSAALTRLLLVPVLAYAGLALAWAEWFERGPRQATPGMRLLGLRVVAADGRAPDGARVLRRHLAAGLSWLSLNLGHALAALPPEHLALHDRLSGTRVVWRAGAGPHLPGWARAWLLLQALLALAVPLWLLARLQATLQAALGDALGG
ncbi:RDD family protein [Thermomonas flagellata]|uniref:RDD family protein n=1 Tax=Thermomonas flagellata TaxID=2888524 RepID=UPI001F041E7B|nr:RDD family protein [Thermomonas flagellata]